MTRTDAEDWPRIRELFRAASKLEPHERPQFLSRACPGDPRLVEEVLDLAAHADSGGNPLRKAIGQAAYEIAARKRRF